MSLLGSKANCIYKIELLLRKKKSRILGKIVDIKKNQSITAYIVLNRQSGYK